MTRVAVALLSLAIFAVPRAAEAQQGRKVYRIAYLGAGSPATMSNELFVQELRQLGWSEGQNLTIQHRWAEGRGFDRLTDLGRQAVSLNPDVIVVNSTLTGGVLPAPTRTIPVVVSAFDRPMGTDPNSPLRAFGNLTGVNLMAGELTGKLLQLLKEILPQAHRVAVIRGRGWHSAGGFQESVNALGMRARLVEISEPDEFTSVERELARERLDGVLVQPHDMLIHYRRQIVDLLTRRRLPAVFTTREYVEVGGLMAFGPSPAEIQRQMARLVDRLLRGAKPADLPVEQPTRFELVINLKTAKALGLTIPQSVLLRADEVIQW